MSKIATLLLIFFSLLASAQQEASIQHYQRTWDTDTIHMPCEKWGLKGLNITIPDSLYSSGNITVKKMRYQGVKGFGYSVEIKNGKVSKVLITAKGRKKVDILLLLDSYIYEKYNKEPICRPVSFLNATGRSGTLILVPNTEELRES